MDELIADLRWIKASFEPYGADRVARDEEYAALNAEQERFDRAIDASIAAITTARANAIEEAARVAERVITPNAGDVSSPQIYIARMIRALAGGKE